MGPRTAGHRPTHVYRAVYLLLIQETEVEEEERLS